MSKWAVVEQVEKVGKLERTVFCKNLRFRPDESAGNLSFVPIGFPLYQVLVEHEERKGNPFILKWMKHRGFPRFVVTYPKLGEDTTPEKEDFVSWEGFRKYCVKKFGTEVATTILWAFSQRIPEVVKM